MLEPKSTDEHENELEALLQEKIMLAKKLGVWDMLNPVPGYKETMEYARLQEIDKRLWELVK